MANRRVRSVYVLCALSIVGLLGVAATRSRASGAYDVKIEQMGELVREVRGLRQAVERCR